jgi:pilus assembly protein FimV
VHNSKLKRMTVALCMAMLPISVFAAGLGKLNVMSGLGEPLKADIELIAVTPEELSSITAAIASQDDYATQGIEKPASHNTIKVEVAKNASGTPILKLKSAQPISEPFLDMLIRVDWASGRLLREYTVLLDPPGYTGEADASAQTAQAPIVASRDSTQKRMNQAPIKASPDNSMMDEAGAAVTPSRKSNKHSKKTKPVGMPADTELIEGAGQDYTTQRGDTLAKVAREMKPEGVSLEQMLVGLYQANPNAFEGDNMNRLKVGQILRQPSQETLNAISHGEARKEIKVQTANWNAYRNKLAGMVGNATADDAEANSQSVGGKIKSAAEDKSTPAATEPKDVVKLSIGDAATAKADSANVKVLQDKIAALQEEATAREKSVQEAQSRTAELEKQIADMQKLLALKNGAMADMQTQAAQAETKPAEASKPAEIPVVKPQNKPANANASPVTAKIEAPVVEKHPVAKPALAPASEPVEETGFITNLLGGLDTSLLAPLGGALALLGGGWFYLRKKRAKSLADFEQGIMTSGGLKANTVFGNTANSNVETGDTSFLTDFSQSANGGMIDTNDVDPIAEAEVYMAYGRDAQAEEILKDAIAKEPKRHELHLKLLEMYAASKNLSAFETIAGELYTSLGAEDPTWAKVAEIGVKLEPSNPLYQVNSQSPGMAEKLDASDFSDSPLAAEKDLDFSFDNQSLVQDFASNTITEKQSLTTDLPLDLPDLTFANDELEALSATTGLAGGAVAADGLAVESFMDDKKVEDIADDAFKSDDNSMDFEMPQLGSSVGASAESSNLADNLQDSMQSLDIPTFAEPKFMPEVAAEEVKTDVSAEFNTDFAAFQTGFPSTMAPAETVMLDEASFETASFGNSFTEAEAADDSDFSFDVTHDQQPSQSAEFKDADFADANTFDLTTINLDLDESNNNVATAIEDTTLGLASAGLEPIEVETKLDLVAAYIEMDDKVGAKELLQEVIKEGGTQQRKRAEAFLAKLA